MAYQVYLSDANNNATELDTENIDFKTVFAVADITDIAARKDNVKTISFKGTKVNNNAFGSYFDLGRTSDITNTTGLFYNYNPIIKVLALIYEDSALIFKGSLRVSQMKLDSGLNVIYDCVVTGSYIDFKTVIQDLYLTDLDFSNLKHRYNIANVTNSWNTSTERFVDGNFTSSVFANGSGYVYPMIDYGNIYSPTITGTNVNQLNMKNYKPAIFLKEYLDRIFTQKSLPGYSYEIKGSSDFINQFNKLIVPDCSENLKQNYTHSQFNYSQAPNTTTTQSGYVNGIRSSWKLLPLTVVGSSGSSVTNLLQPYNNYTDVFSVLRSFTATAGIAVSISATNNQTDGFGVGIPCNIHCELVKRSVIANDNPTSQWAVIGQSQFSVAYGATVAQNVTAFAGITDYTVNDQLAIRIRVELYNTISTIAVSNVNYNVTSAVLSVPGNTTDVLSAVLLPTHINGDSIIPAAPVSIKQTDFIKSIMLQFNLYAYTTNNNYKHIIFQKYDDYYALMQPSYIMNSSLDWSTKIDYSKGINCKSNLTIPKSYLFTHKTDVDSLTDYYFKKFNLIYGSKTFDDILGLTAQKKVELIFSPCILTSYNGSDRKFMALYKVSTGSVQLTKTNIRLCYYNGLQPCQQYTIENEETTSGIISLVPYFTGTTYPQVSNYYLDINGNAVNDLHFDKPAEMYFTSNSSYTNASTSYQNYYINQISELTNPNTKFIDFSVLLNEIDISNLDLHTPIYIQTGTIGSSYFKVLSIEYDGNKSLSSVSLQSIPFL